MNERQMTILVEKQQEHFSVDAVIRALEAVGLTLKTITVLRKMEDGQVHEVVIRPLEDGTDSVRAVPGSSEPKVEGATS